MKILQINCVYDFGSTGKIVENIHNYLLAQGVDSIVCYGRGDKLSKGRVIKISTEIEAKMHSLLSHLFGEEFSYSVFSTNRLIRLLKKGDFDVVHLHCLNGHFVNVYRILNFLKENNIPTILTLHAEIMHTAGCEHACECEKWKTECCSCEKIRGLVSSFYRDDALYCFRMMHKAFLGFKNLAVVGVSEWLTERAKVSAIFKNIDCSFTTVHNGVDTNVFKRYEVSCKREEYLSVGYKGIILHVTPNFNHPIKGGIYVLELAKRMPDYLFIIVGYNGKAVLPKNIIPIAHTKNQVELAEFYNIADVTVLTSKRETFSMVCAESFCCGTPVVGFVSGGPETISLKGYSNFVEYGNVSLLKESIKNMIDCDYKSTIIECMGKKAYSVKSMCEDYRSLYDKAYRK